MNATYDHELVKRMIDEAVKAEREACTAHAITAAEKAIDVAIKLEREACAKVCDDHWEKGGAAYYCAKTIRYRGQA